MMLQFQQISSEVVYRKERAHPPSIAQRNIAKLEAFLSKKLSAAYVGTTHPRSSLEVLLRFPV